MAEALHARYDAVADEPVPKRLEIDRLVRTAAPMDLRRDRRDAGGVHRRRRRRLAGARRCRLAVGVPEFHAWTRSTRTGSTWSRCAIPVEVPGSERAHLQQWLTKRCGWDVRAPELDATGLKLVGGRLLPGPDRAGIVSDV